MSALSLESRLTSTVFGLELSMRVKSKLIVYITLHNLNFLLLCSHAYPSINIFVQPVLLYTTNCRKLQLRKQLKNTLPTLKFNTKPLSSYRFMNNKSTLVPIIHREFFNYSFSFIPIFFSFVFELFFFSFFMFFLFCKPSIT